MGVNNRQRRAAKRRQKQPRRESPGVRQPRVGATGVGRHDSAPDDLIAFAVAHLWPDRLELPDGRTLRTRISHPPDRTDHGAGLFAHIDAVRAQGDGEVHEYGGSESGVGSRARSRRCARRDRAGVASCVSVSRP
jgi:hypothetical protein